MVEFARHVVAVVLAPIIAASKIRSVSFGQALVFVPVIMIEHSAFSFGMMYAAIQKAIAGAGQAN